MPADTLEFARMRSAEALARAETLDCMSPVHTSLLRAFQDEPFVFFEYICTSSDPARLEDAEAGDLAFWAATIDGSFRGFAATNSAEAQNMMREVVVAGHPLLSQGTCDFEVDTFLAQSLELEPFVAAAARSFFGATMNELAARGDADAQLRLVELLQQQSDATSWKRRSIRHAYTFLMHVGMESLWLAGGDATSTIEALLDAPEAFAAEVYDRMKSASPALARKAQRALWRV